MSYDWYSFLRFNEHYKIYKLKDNLAIYRTGLNISSLRSTRIDFCRNDFALIDKKYKNEEVNKYFEKYGKIIKQMRINALPPDEQEEVYSTLHLEKYNYSWLEMLLYKIIRYYYASLYDQPE